VKLPPASGAQTIEALIRAGFTVNRVHGSHYVLKGGDPLRRVTVPFHRKELAPKTQQTILRQAGISIETYAQLL
jgi:predicted RNA binding protein YcfA (HicA-like mRNA interferase family)